MNDQLNKLTLTLKQNGYSLTTARKTVFLALLDREPQTMAELAQATAGTIDRASVYRTITLFESLGVVQRLQLGWKHKLELSDDFAAHHHHMSCIRCGIVRPFEEGNRIGYELKLLADEAGFRETGHQLEVRGICQSCQKQP